MARRVFLIVGFLASVSLTLAAAPEVSQGVVDMIEELKLFSKAMGAIHEAYVGETKPRNLTYEAIRGMLTGIGDKYAQFFDPSMYELLQMSIRGEYAGIGVVLQIIDRYPQVMQLRPEGAAFKAGVQPGDRILKINGDSIENVDLPEVAKRLRGEADSDVQLSLLRPSVNKVVELTIKREKIEIESVKDARIVSKGIGYISIVNFQENTTEQVNQALGKLDKQGLKELIIDLRDNGGGLLEQAVDLASLFLPPNKKVVSVKSKIKEQQKEHFTSGKYAVRKDRLVILVNEKSASASEIFSACLQDYRRATVIGTQTFGKASVQSVVPLDEKTAMKFTTARYLSPLGRMIDGVGIKPDEIIEKKKSDALDMQIVRALSFLNESNKNAPLNKRN